MSFADRALTCRACSVEFVFTAGEQSFFAEKGLLNEPQRCQPCRATRRRERLSQTVREMTPVVCHECGAQTSVPFVPRYDRPVYCGACFEKARAAQV
jgi:CxxC-x17-CxxC domain-containing protein